jgi:hypothetical protein
MTSSDRFHATGAPRAGKRSEEHLAVTGSKARSAAATLAEFRRYDSGMTAQPDNSPGGHEQIHLGGETAVIVPLDEYRKLKALERHATLEEIELAEAEAAEAEYREWVAAGRPGAMSHEEAMAQLLTGQ